VKHIGIRKEKRKSYRGIRGIEGGGGLTINDSGNSLDLREIGAALHPYIFNTFL